MKTIADLHTHTLVSQHAYSTIHELLGAAREKDFAAVAITDHGPAMPDGASALHFLCLNGLPESADGVRLYKGAETNIISYDGSLDLDESILSRLDFVIASYHVETIKPSSAADHTAGLVAAASNRLVHCLGHTGNPQYDCDHEKVVAACAQYGKLIEINAASFRVRAGSDKNCRDIALLCKRHGVRLVVNSDAHSCYALGDHAAALELLEAIDFPAALVVNSSRERLRAYFADRA